MKQQRRTRTEDYLAAVERVCATTGQERAATGAVAREIGVTTGTASIVLKGLAEDGLIDLIPYAGAALTKEGRERTRRLMRRYQLLELLLSQVLGFDAANATSEARTLEPAASETLVERIDSHLGRPAVDQHGHAIRRDDDPLTESPA